MKNDKYVNKFGTKNFGTKEKKPKKVKEGTSIAITSKDHTFSVDEFMGNSLKQLNAAFYDMIKSTHRKNNARYAVNDHLTDILFYKSAEDMEKLTICFLEYFQETYEKVFNDFDNTLALADDFVMSYLFFAENNMTEYSDDEFTILEMDQIGNNDICVLDQEYIENTYPAFKISFRNAFDLYDIKERIETMEKHNRFKSQFGEGVFPEHLRLVTEGGMFAIQKGDKDD